MSTRGVVSSRLAGTRMSSQPAVQRPGRSVLQRRLRLALSIHAVSAMVLIAAAVETEPRVVVGVDSQLAALISLYNATNGTHWANRYGWSGTPPIDPCVTGTSVWSGITCNRTAVVYVWTACGGTRSRFPACILVVLHPGATPL